MKTFSYRIKLNKKFHFEFFYGFILYQLKFSNNKKLINFFIKMYIVKILYEVGENF